MPIAHYYVLTSSIGVLNILSDDEASIVTSEEDEKGQREIIRRYIKPDFEKLTEESALVYKNTFRYYLTTNEINFDDIFSHQQDSYIYPPADPRDFFVWIWEELFPGEDYEISDLSDWKVDNDTINVLRGKT